MENFVPTDVITHINKYNNKLKKEYGLYDIVEDAKQEGIIAYLAALNSYDPNKGEITKWVLLNVWNAMRKYYREENQKRMYSEFDEETYDSSSDKFDVYVCDAVKDAISSLTILEQHILLERLKGVAINTIAEYLDISTYRVTKIFDNSVSFLKEKVTNDTI